MRQRWIKKDLFAPAFGDLIAEVPAGEVENLVADYTEIGAVTEEAVLAYGDVTISLKEAEQAWTGTLEKYLQQSLQQILIKK